MVGDEWSDEEWYVARCSNCGGPEDRGWHYPETLGRCIVYPNAES